jgi:hypothetical protein
MSSEANQQSKTDAVAKQAPTEQQESKPGVPRRFTPGQTVCNEKNEKGKLCNGHLKQLHTQHPSAVFLRGDDMLHGCQTCGALYMGPPMGHVRDTNKQSRYVERDLAAILRAAGGTLPAYDYPAAAWRGAPKPRPAASAKAAAPAKAVAASSAPAPAGETPEQKKARLVAEHKAKLAAKSAPAATDASNQDSTLAAAESATIDSVGSTGAGSAPSADAHRPAAEAQAATGQASAAPLSPTASTASPAAGAETVSDLATEASTELTPGAPKDDRPKAFDSGEVKPKKASGAGFKVPPELQPKPGETMEEKIARLKRINEEAKRAAGKL